jgi:glyoxylate reductase
MALPTVYLTRKLPHRALQSLRAACGDLRVWEEDRPVPREVLLREADRADGLLVMLTERVDTELLDAAPNLKAISTMSVGYDHIDVAACAARGIPVGYTPEVLTDATADHAFALLLAAARRIPEGERYVHSGQWGPWKPDLLLGQQVSGATLGIIGFGRIGQAVARRASGFDMRVLAYGGRGLTEAASAYGAHPTSLEGLLEEADFISVHVSLSSDTYHLIGRRELSMMKKTAILINTARGGVVDHQALYDALKGGAIAAAALDVTEPEPINPDHPLLTLDNCLIVPHIASATYQTRERMGLLAVDNLLAALHHEPLPAQVGVS